MQTNIPTALEHMTVVEQWTGPKNPMHDRGRNWYVATGTLVVAGAAYGIVFDSLIFSVVCVLTGAVYFLTRNHEAPKYSCTILREGILYEQRFIRWEDIAGFWSVNTQTSMDLRIVMKLKEVPGIRIQLPKENNDHVRFVLSQYTTELHGQREHVLDIIIRYCKL